MATSALKWDICHPVPSKAQRMSHLRQRGGKNARGSRWERWCEMSASGWDTTVVLKLVATEVTCVRSSCQNLSMDGEGLSRPLAKQLLATDGS